MSFVPALPLDGYPGWKLLNRTLPIQKKLLQSDPAIKREVEYFRNNVNNAKTVDDLINDKRLLNVTLTAFGLEGDLKSKAFIEKVIKSDLSESGSLANKLADKRYLSLAKSIKITNQQNPYQDPQFVDSIIDQFYAKRFEAAVGESHPNFRLAMNLERDLKILAQSPASDDTKWFGIMGNKPMREVFEKALGLPSGLGKLDIDQQLRIFKTQLSKKIGISSIREFDSPSNMEKLIKTYISKEYANRGASSSQNQVALYLLTAASQASGGG